MPTVAQGLFAAVSVLAALVGGFALGALVRRSR